VPSIDLYRLTRDERLGAVVALAATAAVVVVLAPFQKEVSLLNEGLALLLVTLVIAATWGWRVGLLAALLTNLALNFFFVDPLHTVSVRHPENVGALVTFLIVSVVAGSLLSRARAAAGTAARRQAETEVLLQLSRELIGRADPNDALAVLCENITRAFFAPAASVLSPVDGEWSLLAHAGDDAGQRPPDGSEKLMARQALNTRHLAWLGDAGLRAPRRVVPPGKLKRKDRSRAIIFVPLLIGDRSLGVLRIHGPIGSSPFRDRPQQLLEAFAREAALGVQRVELARAAALAESLKQADEFKSALLASVSHDLKTPLASIKAAVSSLLDANVRWSQDDIHTFLETIDSQVDRLDKVIGDILDLNRIESGALKPSQRPIEVLELLAGLAERTRDAIAGRELRIHSPGGLVVDADEALLVQALVNLVENAGKYSRPGAPVNIRARLAPAGIEIAVEDEGPGIDPQDLPYVFDRFFRGGDKRVKGSGLGLAIAKGFITLSAGTIRVESSPRGTRLVITLPASQRVGTGA
jgi:two-component system sensor histidine kinase KdpD